MQQPLRQVIGQRAAQARSGASKSTPDPAIRFRPAPGPALSPLAQALEQRGRRFRIFPYPGLKSGYIGILLGHGVESERALLDAHKDVGEHLAKGRGAPQARQDADLINGAKVRHILYYLTAEAVDADRLRTVERTGKPYPAFPSPAWIDRNLGPDEQAALMHLVEEVRESFVERPALDDLDEVAAELDEHGGAWLATVDRAEVVRLCVEMARGMRRATAARDALMAGAELGPSSADPAGR